MTAVLTLSVILFGVLSYSQLPVNDLPAVDYPVIQVSVGYPGASPDTIANNIATPLERQFMQINGLEVVTSKSTQGVATFTLQFALDKGFEGLRISGNAFWIESNQWKEFCEYEHELDETLEGRPMLVLCTYSLGASRAVDVLDVASAHQFTVALRHGQWEFLETPELKQAKQEIKSLSEALFVLSRPFPGHELLTARERVVLAQIVRGASAKEAARSLDISPRTIEFHRNNIVQKLGAKNVADLVRIAVGNIERSEASD